MTVLLPGRQRRETEGVEEWKARGVNERVQHSHRHEPRKGALRTETVPGNTERREGHAEEQNTPLAAPVVAERCPEGNHKQT